LNFNLIVVSLNSRESFRKSSEELNENLNGSRATLRRNQENPPSSVPPPPPNGFSSTEKLESMRAHGSATANFSKPTQKLREEGKQSHHGIYSSNDSGFSNELPPVDYSDDDDLPKKIPIR
jgi:hypothetical protein